MMTAAPQCYAIPTDDLQIQSASCWLAWLIRINQANGLVQLTRDELSALCTSGQAEHAATYAFEHLQAQLRNHHVPLFWSRLDKCASAVAAGDAAALGAQLHAALKELCAVVEEGCSQLQQLVEHLNKLPPSAWQQQVPAGSGFSTKPSVLLTHLYTLPSRYRMYVSAVLLATATLSMSGLLRCYYGDKISQLSEVMTSQSGELKVVEDQPPEEGNEENTNPAVIELRYVTNVSDTLGEDWSGQLREVSHCLSLLSLDAASEEAYTAVINQNVREHLTKTAHRVFDRRVLPQAVKYVNWVPLEFLKLVLHHGEPEAEKVLQEWRLRLTYYMYETLGSLRISEMFEIVIDYPDSLPAIQDTAECLRHTNLHSRFITQFRVAVQQRLLHAGASATDIIHQYVSTIRTLREIDPTGSLLSAVGEPIRQYLRGRADTIRCLVTMVTQGGEDGGESLLEELQEAAMDHDMPDSTSHEDPDEAVIRLADATAALDTNPLAAAGGPSSSATASRRVSTGTHADGGAADIVSMLIGVFGSKDIFINEYRLMLATQLLYSSDYDCDREIRTTELLKLRFGESALHACEVMLKDLADSKRIDANVHALDRPAAAAPSAPNHLDQLHTTILSHLFWPKEREKEPKEAAVKLPASISSAMEEYALRYHSLKSPRQLNWKKHLGVVELDVAVGDVTVSFRVSPVMASIIAQFTHQEQYTAVQLAAAVGLPLTLTRRKAVFWVNNNVLIETKLHTAGSGAAGMAERSVVYQRAKQLDPSLDGLVISDYGAEDEAPTTLPSAQDSLLEEMAPYENYVLGMLTNYVQLPLDRLHNMLRLFVVSPKYDKTQEQLSAFLAHLAAQEKIVLDNGMYKHCPQPPQPSEN